MERDACRLEMSKVAIDKKDLSETIEILTTRCRLFEEDRNNVATRNAAPKAVPVSTNHPAPAPAPASAPTGNSPLETLINLEVLKAVKAFPPSSDTAAPARVPLVKEPPAMHY